MLIYEYKDRFDKLVKCFLDLVDKEKQIYFVTGLQNSIEYDVKALKLYTFGKIYSMAFTSENKNVELGKEKNIFFDVFRKDHSREKNIEKWKRFQKFSHPDGQCNVRLSNKFTFKDQVEHHKK